MRLHDWKRLVRQLHHRVPDQPPGYLHRGRYPANPRTGPGVLQHGARLQRFVFVRWFFVGLGQRRHCFQHGHRHPQRRGRRQLHLVPFVFALCNGDGRRADASPRRWRRSGRGVGWCHRAGGGGVVDGQRENAPTESTGSRRKGNTRWMNGCFRANRRKEAISCPVDWFRIRNVKHTHKLQSSCLLIEGELLLPNPRHMHHTKRKPCQSQTLPSFSCCDSLGPLASASHPFLSECQEWTEAKAASVHQTEEQQKL
ncbi:hypothetical protein HDK77DRAFT_212148 [Phyllosticta capitalensis]